VLQTSVNAEKYSKISNYLFCMEILFLTKVNAEKYGKIANNLFSHKKACTLPLLTFEIYPTKLK